MKAAPGQKLLFVNDLPEVQILRLPPYHRNQIYKPEEGVSPREGFRLANELLGQGHTEKQIDPAFEQWYIEERHWIEWLLTRIIDQKISSTSERIEKEADRFKRALHQICDGKRGLTPMETGLWFYEMDPDSLTDPERNPRKRTGIRKSDIICVNKTHALLGSFRRHIQERYSDLLGNSVMNG